MTRPREGFRYGSGELLPNLLWSRPERFTRNKLGAWLNDGWTLWRRTANAMVALVEVFIRVTDPVVAPDSRGKYPTPLAGI